MSMKALSAGCDEELLLVEGGGSRTAARRVWPAICAGAVFAVVLVGWGIRRMRVSSPVLGDDVTSLHEYSWYPAWRTHLRRYDHDGCTLDGDDCRSSRCCAKAGSRCFVKNHHWASCNETCQINRKWQGSIDRRGHWITTYHPVWECADITVTRVVAEVSVTEVPTTAAPVKEEVVTVTVPAPAPTNPPSSYSIYEQSDDFKTSRYGAHATQASEPAASSSVAPVTWAEIS